MSVDELIEAAGKLSSVQRDLIRKAMDAQDERDWAAWDRQIEQDDAAGRLDWIKGRAEQTTKLNDGGQ